MAKLQGPFYDKNNERYYEVTLIPAGDRINLNGRMYLINQARLDETTFFKTKRHKVELNHPTVAQGMTEKEVMDACYRERDIMLVAELRDIKVNRDFDVVSRLYPRKDKTFDFDSKFDQGYEVAMRAITNGSGSITDVICFDFVKVDHDVHLQERQNAKTPPLNTTVMVSGNGRSTWFPAQFLWIGQQSFVWRNLSPGAREGNEIPEKAHHTYFNWVEVGDLELRTYHSHQESEEIQAYFGYKRKD